MARKFEIMFNPKTGNLVVHFSGVPTHAEEHALKDRFIRELRQQGFDVDEEHFHDQPRIPEVEHEDVLKPRTRVRGG